MGQRLNIIFVSEGAIDIKGNPITATQVQQVRYQGLCIRLFSNYCQMSV